MRSPSPSASPSESLGSPGPCSAEQTGAGTLQHREGEGRQVKGGSGPGTVSVHTQWITYSVDVYQAPPGQAFHSGGGGDEGGKQREAGI